MAASTQPPNETPKPPTNVFLGVVLEYNQQEIRLEPAKAISELKKYGMEVALPPGQVVRIGTAEGAINGLIKAVDSTAPSIPKKETLPDIEVLQNAYDALISAEVAITEFRLKLPGTETKGPDGKKDKNNYFSVGLAATWAEGKGELVGSLKLKGVFFKASNFQDGTVAPRLAGS